MLKQQLINDKKRVKPDWTLAEWRCPVRNDVIIDDEKNMFFVTKVSGDISERLLWASDIFGNVVYEGVRADEFTVADARSTENFHDQYRQNIGWKPGKIFTVKDKDYPLRLKALEYDTKRRKTFYVFEDINTPDFKLFKTHKEEILDIAPDDMYAVAYSAFHEDDTSSLRYQLLFDIIDRGEEFHNGWSVSGSSMQFGEKEQAENEIEKFMYRNVLRRLASAFSMYPKSRTVQFSINEDRVFIEEFKFYTGQPALFNSRTIAGVVLEYLGDDKIKKALSYEHDTYML